MLRPEACEEELLLTLGSNALTIYNICQLIDMLRPETCEEELLLPLGSNALTVYNICLIIDVLRPEACEEELLLPLGSNTVTIHNEQHTMSAMVVFFQINSTSLEQSCLLGKIITLI